MNAFIKVNTRVPSYLNVSHIRTLIPTDRMGNDKPDGEYTKIYLNSKEKNVFTINETIDSFAGRINTLLGLKSGDNSPEDTDKQDEIQEAPKNKEEVNVEVK